jgi:hypothetical protein
VSYAVDPSTDYTLYESGLTSTSATVTGLTAGVNYKFVIQSRNVINFSDYSSAVSVLAAQIPDEPTSLSNVPTVTTAY